jgi:hypothetical protein
VIPSTGALWGDDAYNNGFTAVETAVGRRFAIHRRHYGQGWASSAWPWPTAAETADAALRSPSVMPMITVAATMTGANGFPVCTAGGSNGTFSNTAIVNGHQGLDRVTAGEFDSMFTAAFTSIAAIPGPVWVNLWQESNIPAMGGYYQFQRKTGETIAQAQTRYINAWRHVHGLAVAAGATNIIWVWSITGFVPTGDTQAISLGTYPGDAYVDVVGADRYRHDLSFVNWIYAHAVARSKAFIIAETGVNPAAGGGQPTSGPATIAADLASLKTAAWIEAIAYVNWENNNACSSSLADAISCNQAAYNTFGADAWMGNYYTAAPNVL